jgi:hypothetical protein
VADRGADKARTAAAAYMLWRRMMDVLRKRSGTALPILLQTPCLKLPFRSPRGPLDLLPHHAFGTVPDQ